MPENLPLQKRTGFNRGQQSNLLLRARFLGQPAIKAGAGDTVIFKNAPELPGRGQNNIRSQISNLSICGWVFNRTGADVDFDFILVDANGNEFRLYDEIILPDGQNYYINPYSNAIWNGGGEAVGNPLPVLLPGWSVVLRVFSGNPTSGKGLIVWPWAQGLSNNLMALMVPLSNSFIELGPDPGRAWQLCAKKGLQAQELAPAYFNFDSITHTIEQGAEIYHLAGEDVPVNDLRPDIVIAPRTSLGTGTDTGFLTVNRGTFKKPKGLVLAYPDKIKVRMKEAQRTAPLYLLVPFAEFDLPMDMHVEE